MSKQILRTAIKNKLRNLTNQQKLIATEILEIKLLAHPKLQSAETIGVFVSSEKLNEIGTHKVIETFLQEVFDLKSVRRQISEINAKTNEEIMNLRVSSRPVVKRISTHTVKPLF